MIPYFFSYSLISILAILEFYKIKIYIDHKDKINLFVIIYLCLFMGFKFHVGGDWGTYKNYFNEITTYNLNYKDLNNDIGYYILNLYIYKLGFDFKILNLISSVIPLLGLHFLAKKFPSYWLFLLILTPYFLFIILMGYTRQSIAIGLFFIALSFLFGGISKRNICFYLLFIIVAFFFHKSSFIFLPVPLLFIRLNSYSFSIFIHLITIFFLFLIFLVFNDWFISRLKYFFSNQYSSFGGYLRISIFFILCTLNLVLIKARYKFSSQIALTHKLSIIALLICSMVFLIPSTVIIDRLLLYLYFIIPATLIFLIELSKNNINKSIILYSIITFGFIFMILWFNYATNSFSWLPYKNYLFM
tara:strand:- start:203 stop:1279 length:1077 start_codon:yes stop_codon:yes gene_type:complete